MGNIQSHLYGLFDEAYARYYPKSKYLRPAYVSSTIMISGIGAQLFLSKKSLPADRAFSFMFLTSTGANLGLQLWVSFISGMTMIRVLPRQEFGLVQSHLFPKYFFLSSMFSFTSLCAFLHTNPISTWKNETLWLGSFLGVSFLLNVLNFSYLNIKTIEYGSRMREIEKLTGEELNVVGRIKNDSRIENDPTYKKTKKSFLWYHGFVATTNVLSFALNVAQLYMISGKPYFSL